MGAGEFGDDSLGVAGEGEDSFARVELAGLDVLLPIDAPERVIARRADRLGRALG